MNPGPAIAVTVIIATHNRASRLRETLEALVAQRTPAGLGWEILVVDNGSNDGTLALRVVLFDPSSSR